MLRGHEQNVADVATHIQAGNPRLQAGVIGLSQKLASSGLDKHTAQLTAYAQIYRLIQAQASASAYIDTFMVLCVGSAIMIFLSFALKKNDPGGGHVVVE